MSDLVLVNCRVYTMSSNVWRANAIALRGSRILAVGAEDDVVGAAAADAQIVDLGGRAVLPGLIDSHTHLIGYGFSLVEVDLEPAMTLAEALERVRRGAENVPVGGWVRGRGWDKNLWGGALPTRHDLDAVVPDRPVALSSKDGHVLWVNTLALERAGITAATPNPAGGEIERDERTGAPTGVLKEAAADLVFQVTSKPTAPEVDAALRRAIQRLHQFGMTSVHDMGGGDASAWTLAGLQRLRAAGEPIVRALHQIPREHLDQAIALGLRTGFGDEWLRLGGVKIFADGALGSQTAAMLEPYQGQPDNRGIVVTPAAELAELVREAASAGLASMIHAIGDYANRIALDAIGAARSAGIVPELRHRIEHAQIVAPADLERFAALGVIASVQPIHAVSDRDLADRYWGDRSRTAYAYRSLIEAGAILAFGSDVPIESPDPLLGLYAAVSRKRPGERDRPAWYPEQALTLEQAVAGYTRNAAFASGEEHLKGTLEPGKLADLVVLSNDILISPVETLLETAVECTILGGEVVYGAL